MSQLENRFITVKTVNSNFQANNSPLPLKTVNIRVLTRISLYFFSQCGKSFLFIIFSVRYLNKIGHVTLLIYALKYNAEVQQGPNGVFFCRWGSVRADLTKPSLACLVVPTSAKALRYRQGPDQFSTIYPDQKQGKLVRASIGPYRNFYTETSRISILSEIQILPVLASTRAFLAWNILYYERSKRMPLLQCHVLSQQGSHLTTVVKELILKQDEFLTTVRTREVLRSKVGVA